MYLAQNVRVMACLGLGLLAVTVANSQSSPVLDQITQHEQVLAEARAARRVSDEGFELIVLGYLYRQAGQMQKALNCLNEALSIEQNAGNQAAQAMAQNTMGRVYSDLGAVRPDVAHLAQPGDSASGSQHADQYRQGL
jgi:tetratricopeptide (TPR) repeat protein